jgi:hypothetical protein
VQPRPGSDAVYRYGRARKCKRKGCVSEDQNSRVDAAACIAKARRQSVHARAANCPSINTYRADHCHAYVFHARLLEGFPQARRHVQRLKAAATDAR